VTLDKDFGELAVVRGARHAGIIRLVNLAARSQGSYAALAAERYQEALSNGAIVTVSSTRVRVRAGPRAR
jgi:predicted nuclease of predicted toxin-antitoxin system